jgi:hypothetical protein
MRIYRLKFALVRAKALACRLLLRDQGPGENRKDSISWGIKLTQWTGQSRVNAEETLLTSRTAVAQRMFMARTRGT